MKLSRETDNDISVVALDGEIDTGCSEEVKGYLLRALQEGGDSIIIDLSRVPYMSSVGLQILLDVYQTSKLEEVDLILASPKPRLMKILEISGYSSFLTIYDSAEEAIASIQPKGG